MQLTVLFVGLSNAARSPMAEALARHLGLTAYSAGQRPSHVRREVKEALEEIGVSANGLRAKSVAEVPLDDIDLVVLMHPEVSAPKGIPRRLAWLLPDPSSAPPEERAESFRAARDELMRRIVELRA